MRSLRLRFALPMIVGALSMCSQAAARSHSIPSPVTAVAHGSIADFMTEASLRFGIPERWIDAVMRVESAGDPSAISRAGAMGLMQLMPQTYAMLRTRLGLGASPFDPHDNIIAGAAYLREMHDRYGKAGFLAAYNAGPARWEDYLAAGRQLPSQTIGYIVRLGRMLDVDASASPGVRRARVIVTPEAAPIFVRLSGVRTDTRSHAFLSNEDDLGASGKHDDIQPVASIDAIPLRSNASQSANVPATQRTAMDDRTSTLDATGSPSSQPSNPLFVVRTVNQVKP